MESGECINERENEGERGREEGTGQRESAGRGRDIPACIDGNLMPVQ